MLAGDNLAGACSLMSPILGIETPRDLLPGWLSAFSTLRPRESRGSLTVARTRCSTNGQSIDVTHEGGYLEFEVCRQAFGRSRSGAKRNKVAPPSRCGAPSGLLLAGASSLAAAGRPPGSGSRRRRANARRDCRSLRDPTTIRPPAGPEVHFHQQFLLMAILSVVLKDVAGRTVQDHAGARDRSADGLHPDGSQCNMP